MNPDELARENHKFLYVDLPLGIFEEDGYFDYAVCRAARIHEEITKDAAVHDGEKPFLEDRFGTMSFLCQNGECGYIQISGKSAKLIYEKTVDIDKVVHRIPGSIQGDHNDRCVISIDGFEIIIRIVSYEGVSNGKFSLINDPTDDAVLGGTPLGRVVIITASPQGEEVPVNELVNSWE